MTLEEQYKQETGYNAKTVMIPEGATAAYVDWLETRLTLALSRIEAAEKERDELKQKLSEPTVGMVMAYEAGMSDREQWKSRCGAAEEYIKELEYYLPEIPKGKVLDAMGKYIETVKTIKPTRCKSDSDLSDYEY